MTMAIVDLAIIGYREATNYRDISYNRYYRSGLPVQCNTVDDPLILYCSPQVIILLIFIDVHVMA